MTIANRSVPAAAVIPTLAYPSVAEATDWLCDAFGFRCRLLIGDHRAQLVKASYYPSGDFSLNYDFADQSKRGEAPRRDFLQRAGGGKLTMSVLDYVRYLSALELGEIIAKPLVESMKSGRLGFDSVWAGRATGGYPWMNGGCPDFEDKGRGCKTAAMIFPSGIVAYVATNSENNGYSSSIQGVLANAFDAALK